MLPSLARISRAIPRALAAILGPVSSGLTAVADAIATTAAAITEAAITEAAILVVAVDPIIAVGAVPAAVLGSNAAAQVAHIVITAPTPDLHGVLSSFPKC